MNILIKIMLVYTLLLSAGMVLCAPALMQALFFLIISFVAGSIYLLMLGIELLAIYYLIIYVGAIMILFLFVILMSHEKEQRKPSMIEHPLTAIIMITAILFLVDALMRSFYNSDPIHVFTSKLITTGIYGVYNFEFYGPDTLHMITVLLFEHYGILVFWCGVLLYIAMIGAITIVFPGTQRVKRQERMKQ
jgi:NADH-quinone oxidoreductase subunit J